MPLPQELLSQLYLEEKVSLLSGKSNWRTPAIPRLGIKAVKTSDGPNGCRGEAIHASTKTSCFPCGACMGATFDTNLIKKVGVELGKEAKLKNAGVLLGPTINLHRHPYAGRNFESYSEDPVLTGELAAAYVQGLQSQNVAACPKHFVCNECEVFRQQSNSNLDEEVLRGLYLLPFQICIKKSNPWALMTAYNKVNGTWCSESAHLLNDILRMDWKWDGCTISDFGGVYTEVHPVTAGLNLEMPGASVHRGQRLIDNLKLGVVTEADVDKNALEVIKLSSRVGMDDEHANERAEPDEQTSEIARLTATEGLVLLKNQDGILPISPASAPKLAIFGAPASVPIVHGGGSPSLSSHYIITPLQALQNTFSNVEYRYGVPIFRKLPSAPIDCMRTANGEPGVDCHWYNDWDIGKNEILQERLDTTRTLVIDPRIPGLKQKHCTRMSCLLTPKTSGIHTFGVTANGETHLYVDGKETVSHPGFSDTKVEYIMQPGRFEHRANIEMIGGQSYELTIDTLSTIAPPPPLPAFQMAPQATQVGFFENLDRLDMHELRKVASAADVSVVFTGNNKEWESESFDREQLGLSQGQVSMIEELAKVSKKTIVVNQTGAPISMPWLGNVDAVIQTWFAGMEVGNAVADVISGRVSPSGRLPTTFPVRIEDVPSDSNFPCDTNLDINYAEGQKVGYRALADPLAPVPLFPFGHGLSYATFEYSDFRMSESVGAICKVSVTITNKEGPEAKETVQLYVDGILKAFRKVSLHPGETVTVWMELDKYAFSTWKSCPKESSTAGSWRVEPREYNISIRKDALTVLKSGGWTVEENMATSWTGL